MILHKSKKIFVAAIIFCLLRISQAQYPSRDAGAPFVCPPDRPFADLDFLGLATGYTSLVQFGMQYNISYECVMDASSELPACNNDMTLEEGCCTEGCWMNLRLPKIAGACTNSIIVGFCEMFAAGESGAKELLPSLFSVYRRCVAGGELLNCSTFKLSEAGPQPQFSTPISSPPSPPQPLAPSPPLPIPPPIPSHPSEPSPTTPSPLTTSPQLISSPPPQSIPLPSSLSSPTPSPHSSSPPEPPYISPPSIVLNGTYEGYCTQKAGTIKGSHQLKSAVCVPKAVPPIQYKYRVTYSGNQTAFSTGSSIVKYYRWKDLVTASVAPTYSRSKSFEAVKTSDQGLCVTVTSSGSKVLRKFSVKIDADGTYHEEGMVYLQDSSPKESCDRITGTEICNGKVYNYVCKAKAKKV